MRDRRAMDGQIEQADDEGRAAVVASLDLACDISAPRVARGFVERELSGRGCGALVEPTALVVSELVTNAVLHARTACTLRLRLESASLHVEVVDGDPNPPHVRPVDRRQPGGRGLRIIASVSDRWGVDLLEDGKCVWAALSLSRDATWSA